MEIMTVASMVARVVIFTTTTADIGIKAMAFAFGSTLDNRSIKHAGREESIFPRPAILFLHLL